MEGASDHPRTPHGEEEALELLLPGADPEFVRHAERVTDFVRLLGADARARHALVVGVDLERARAEYERRERRRLAEDLGELARIHLAAHLAGTTFLDLGPPALDPEGAWRRLLEARAELGDEAALPAPGEDALSVARRLLRALATHRARREGARARLSLLHAWLARADAGPAAAQATCLEALEDLGSRAPLAVRRPWVAAVAALRLDRGAVREADLWLAAHPGLLRVPGDVPRFAVWTRLLLGDERGARAHLELARPPAGVLPRELLELREARPAWLPLLAGRAPEGEPGPGALRVEASLARGDLARARAEFGACALALCRFDPAAGRALVRLELAPGLRAAARAFSEGREGAHALAGEPEHRLLLGARPVVALREEGRPLRGALGERSSRALALAPILDPAGEVEGWLHLEFEHHLVPARARLELCAGALRGQLLPAAGALVAPRGAWSGAEEPSLEPVSVHESPDPSRALCGRVFEGLVGLLGLKTRERRWWGFEVEGGRPRLVAEGGEGLPGRLEGTRQGGGRGLRRALVTSGAVVFDEPDPELSLHAAAGSGAVVPLVARGKCVGLFVLESRRRRDLGPLEAGRIRAVADGLALALRLAQMRCWHQERFGYDLCFDTSLAGLRAGADRLLAAGRSGEPALLVGPPGAGKSVLARWLHFEGAGAEAPLSVVPLGLEDPGELSRRLEGERGGSLLLEPLEQASTEAQAALCSHLGRGARSGRGGARLIVVAGARPADLAARGVLHADLAARLERLVLFVPPLADRREELCGLATFLCDRFAREEGIRPPRLGEDALALLWRQPWPGNLRQLESWLFELCLLHPGEELGVGQVLEAARRLRQPVLKKIHSRHPRRRDLVAALRSTLKGTGRVNKTRAASFLGWDPDTLVTRLAEARLGEAELASEPWGW